MLPLLHSNAPNEAPPGRSPLLPEKVHSLEVGAFCRDSFDSPGSNFWPTRCWHALARFFARLIQGSFIEIKHFLYARRQSWVGRAKNGSVPFIELAGANGVLAKGVMPTSDEPTSCPQTMEAQVLQIDDPGAHNALRSYANCSSFTGKREDPPPRFLFHLRHTFLTLIELGAGPNEMPAKTTARTL